MIATCAFQGRTGNNFYQLAMLIAYATRHGMQYQVPSNSPHIPGGKLQFRAASTGEYHHSFTNFQEPVNEHGSAYYIDIPKMRNVCFHGFWQSFRYIDDQRDAVLKALNLPWVHRKGVVSIHVRRGDFLHLPSFTAMPVDYYIDCIRYFKERGYFEFYVFSDDIPWCRNIFIKENFVGCHFTFIDGGTDIDDLTYMSCCEHHITANSSFSFAAAWLNQHPDKIVLCPPNKDMWYNTGMVPDYFTQMQY